MKKIKLYYANVPNVGDLLNPIIVSHLSNSKVVRSKLYSANMTAIGSTLNNVLLSKRFKTRIIQKTLKLFSKSFIIWGTGFLREPENNEVFFRKDIKINALRGKLSKNKVQIILNKELDIALGDPGILISDIIPKLHSKNGNLVGVIPHFREQDNIEFEKLKNRFENAIMIDLKGDPISVLQQISACNYILSSSLHGLIIADSYRIPNLPIFVSDKVKGDGFKFSDYYSNFDLEYSPILSKYFDNISEDFILKNYKITDKNVIDMKNSLYKSFPFEKNE